MVDDDHPQCVRTEVDASLTFNAEVRCVLALDETLNNQRPKPIVSSAVLCS